MLSAGLLLSKSAGPEVIITGGLHCIFCYVFDFRSDATRNSNVSETRLRKSEIRRDVPVKPNHHKRSGQSLELSSSRARNKENVTDVCASEINQNSPEPKVKSAFLSRRDIFTQFPTQVDLCHKRSRYKHPANRVQSKEKAVQASASTSASTNGDTHELVVGALSDGGAAGGINVRTQSKDRKAVTENDARESEASDVSKNTRVTSECNEYGETAAKRSELEDDTPLCCCECKKLLSKISAEIKSKNRRSVGVNSYESRTRVGNGIGKEKYDSSSRSTTQSKSTDDDSARSRTLSSSATLGNAVGLTRDSARVRAPVASGTLRNVGVQTGRSVHSLPVTQPHWYSFVHDGTNKMSSKAQNNISSSHKKCPCCGAPEDESDAVSESSHSTAGKWQCSKCFRMKHDRKCRICGVLESELPNVQQDDVSDDGGAWKCGNCSASKLDQAKPVLGECVVCGSQKGCVDSKGKQVDCGCTRNVASAAVRFPVGYHLTVETSTDSVSSVAETSEKLFEEVKMKIPVRKKHSVSDKVKRREKQKQGVSKPGVKSFRQNQKSVRGVKDVYSAEDGDQRRGHYRIQRTLQVKVSPGTLVLLL
jgi:hypothetical protein